MSGVPVEVMLRAVAYPYWVEKGLVEEMILCWLLGMCMSFPAVEQNSWRWEQPAQRHLGAAWLLREHGAVHCGCGVGYLREERERGLYSLLRCLTFIFQVSGSHLDCTLK